MKILSKYVLREHVGPLTFALTALTSIMLLNFISRQFGELVGKGLPWTVIAQFFLLAIPFTVALTVPMSVLVAVLYAYSRLAAENEITALKASGVSPWRLVSPAIAGGIVWSIGLLIFNDQVLPRANHRLAVLQSDISQTKPTFLLKEQVINPVSEGKLYLKAGKIDQAHGGMKEVVIYNMADPTQRRTIYADSGTVMLTSGGKDLTMDLFHGQMQQVSTAKPGELSRLFFDHDRLRVRDVGPGTVRTTDAANAPKSDREMGVCEMQSRLAVAEGSYQYSLKEYQEVKAAIEAAKTGGARVRDMPLGMMPHGASGRFEPHGIGWLYCKVVGAIFGVKRANAATVSGATLHRIANDTVRPALRDTATRRDTTTRRDSTAPARGPGGGPPLPRAVKPQVDQSRPRAGSLLQALKTPARVAPPPVARMSPAAAAAIRGATAPGGISLAADSRLAEAQLRLEMAQRSRNRYEIEIHKKFSLAAACLIFVIVGAPMAVRFPRGGVGLVIGVSLVVFALYYVGLIGGEALANQGIVPPFWAMWGTNVIMTGVGLVLLARMGNDQNTGRGGSWGDKLDTLKARLGRRRNQWSSRGVR